MKNQNKKNHQEPTACKELGLLTALLKLADNVVTKLRGAKAETSTGQ
jgi:hypothetical protein